MSIKETLETIQSMLSLLKPTLFSSNAFNHGKIQHKLYTRLRISKSFPGGSRSKDVQHCQFSCLHVYRRYFSIIIFQWYFTMSKSSYLCLEACQKNLIAAIK